MFYVFLFSTVFMLLSLHMLYRERSSPRYEVIYKHTPYSIMSVFSFASIIVLFIFYHPFKPTVAFIFAIAATIFSVCAVITFVLRMVARKKGKSIEFLSDWIAFLTFVADIFILISLIILFFERNN